MYKEVSVKLTPAQKKRLKNLAEGKTESLNLRLSKNATDGVDQLYLPETQINKIMKARKNGTGVLVQISKKAGQMMKRGGFLSSLLAVAGPMLLESGMKTLQAPSAGQDRINRRLEYLRGRGMDEKKKDPFFEGVELSQDSRFQKMGRQTMQNMQKMADMKGQGFLSDLWEGFKWGITNPIGAVELLINETDRAISGKGVKMHGEGVKFH